MVMIQISFGRLTGVDGKDSLILSAGNKQEKTVLGQMFYRTGVVIISNGFVWEGEDSCLFQLLFLIGSR